MYASSWFLTIFLTSFPLPVATRIFDIFMCEVSYRSNDFEHSASTYVYRSVLVAWENLSLYLMDSTTVCKIWKWKQFNAAENKSSIIVMMYLLKGHKRTMYVGVKHISATCWRRETQQVTFSRWEYYFAFEAFCTRWCILSPLWKLLTQEWIPQTSAPLITTWSVFSGSGDCFPCGPGHPSDEPDGTHPARHGGNVTGIVHENSWTFKGANVTKPPLVRVCAQRPVCTLGTCYDWEEHLS